MIGGLARCATSGSGYSESIESAVNYCQTRPKRCLLAVKVRHVFNLSYSEHNEFDVYAIYILYFTHKLE